MKEKILAFIPARGGSKGVKNKNIKEIGGKPLIYYTIKAAQESNLFEDIIVSTDSQIIADIARKCGAYVPFIRPSHLAKDESEVIDSIQHCIEFMSEKFNKKYDVVINLQPTSPLRTHQHIMDGYNEFSKNKADFVVSVCECDHSPLWSNTLDKSLSMDNFIPIDIRYKRRQELPIYYRVNGALYIGRVSNVLENRGFYGENSYAYIMNKECSVDIDTEFDFKIAELIINLK